MKAPNTFRSLLFRHSRPRRRLVLAVCTLTTTAATAVTASTALPAGATFPGGNGPIAFRQFDPATGRFPLLRANPDGSGVRELTDRPGFFSDWRADGQRLAFDFFDADGNEQIATITPDGGDLRELTSGPGIHEVPSWSPDGRTIVFDFSPEPDSNTPGFHTELWTMRADGTHARRLPTIPAGFDVEPRYSPDGRWIAFDRLLVSSDGQQEQAVFIVRAHGGPVRQLTPFDLNAEHATWSPDSSWITYDSLPALDSPAGTIEAVHPDGSGRRTILAATDSLGGHKPWFSPDGSHVLFMCAITAPEGHVNEDICVMNADGTGIVNLTNSPQTFENWPSWGPTPSTDDQGSYRHGVTITKNLEFTPLVSRAALAGPLGVGAAPPSRTLSVVAIGDSIPYGRGDCGNCATFVDLFGEALARRTGTHVRVQNLSEHTGIDSSDLRKQLTSNSRLRAAVCRTHRRSASTWMPKSWGGLPWLCSSHSGSSATASAGC